MSASAGLPPFERCKDVMDEDMFVTPSPNNAFSVCGAGSSCNPKARGFSCKGPALIHSSIGQPISAVVNRMLRNQVSETHNDMVSMYDDLHGGYHPAGGFPFATAEFTLAWPPTFPVGGPAEMVELRSAVSLDAAAAAAAAAGAGAATGACYGGGLAAAAAAEVCGRVLAVREDVVVGDEAVQQLGGGGSGSARLRLLSDHPCVTSCILASSEGVPSLESFRGAAPLMGLPQAARDEAHRLLWRMMHEALPPNHSVLPFDPDAFRSPLDRLPLKIQAAVSWAWSHHFRAFADDFSFLLNELPHEGADAAAFAAIPTATSTSTSTSTAIATAGFAQCLAPNPLPQPPAVLPANNFYFNDDVSHYHCVLAQMVGFLRDNDMFACLATLLQTAVARGLQLPPDGAEPQVEPRSEAAGIPRCTPHVSEAGALEEASTRMVSGDDGGEDVRRTGAVKTSAPQVPASTGAQCEVVKSTACMGDGAPQQCWRGDGGAATLRCDISRRSARQQAPLARRFVTLLPSLLALLAAAAVAGLRLREFASDGFCLRVCLPAALAVLLAALRAAAAAARVQTPCAAQQPLGAPVVGDSGTDGSVVTSFLSAVQASTAVWYAASAAAAAAAAAPAEAIASAAAAAALYHGRGRQGGRPWRWRRRCPLGVGRKSLLLAVSRALSGSLAVRHCALR